MDLYERGAAAFASASAITRPDPALAAAHGEIAAHRERWLRPMSVALVGRVSSGKSTIVNALLAEECAPTGIGELTRNVSWLRHGAEPGLRVHFTDGRPAERRDRADLEELAARAGESDESRRYLAAIAYLEVTEPNERLRSFDLIDTPGTDAVGDPAHVGKTRAVLGRGGDRMRADTLSFAARADALVLVFARTLHEADIELLADFTRSGVGTANPITAVGALTKVELHWPRLGPDPMAVGRRDAERLMANASVRRVLFDLRPLAGKVASAAGVLTDQDFEDVQLLGKLPADLLRKRLAAGDRFKHEPYPDLPVAAPRRAALFDRFGAYGVHLAAQLANAEAKSPAELRLLLAERSGLTELRRLLADHFARRADVIKLRRAIDAAAALPAQLVGTLTARELDRVRRAVAELTSLDREPVFRELAVVRRWLLGELGFTGEEGAELLRVAGEQGPSLAARLGRSPDAPLAELAAVAAARHEHWSGAAIDPRYAGADHGACQVMLSAYDRIGFEIDRARHGRERD